MAVVSQIDAEPVDPAELIEPVEPVEPVGRWWEREGVYRPAVCHVSPLTGEFMGMGLADPSPLEPGVWLMPADSFAGDEPIIFPGFAAIRIDGEATWQQVPDHRGKTVYDKQTRIASECDVLGELPEALTLDVPLTDFDAWRGGRWVFDIDAQNAALTGQARLRKTLLAQCAAGMVSTLQFAVDKGIATNAEVVVLDAWRTYGVLINRVEPAPLVEWPNSPDDSTTSAYLQSRGFEDIPA